MLIALWAVAYGRATSEAIDPLAGRESRTMQIHMRFLSSTMEQLVLFFVSTLSLSTIMDGDTIRLIPIAAILFATNRMVFWMAYLRDPLLRAIGLSGSIYPITLMVIYAAYRMIKLLAGA